MATAYRFVDRWEIAAPIERVYEVTGDPLGYERWWTDFVLEASGDPGPPEPGKRVELLVKAYLPYKVNFVLEVLDGTRATLDWRPTVNHGLIKHLTPVLRPLFRSNHNWAMRRGERQLREYLGSG